MQVRQVDSEMTSGGYQVPVEIESPSTTSDCRQIIATLAPSVGPLPGDSK